MGGATERGVVVWGSGTAAKGMGFSFSRSGEREGLSFSGSGEVGSMSTGRAVLQYLLAVRQKSGPMSMSLGYSGAILRITVSPASFPPYLRAAIVVRTLLEGARQERFVLQCALCQRSNIEACFRDQTPAERPGCLGNASSCYVEVA